MKKPFPSFRHWLIAFLSMSSCWQSVVAADGPSAADSKLAATPQELEFFESKIRPLLVENCFSCHSAQAKKLKAGLHLDSRVGLLRGGESGPAIVPGSSEQSLLIESVKYESYEMPPNRKLPAADIALLERWVEMGAPWPQEATESQQVTSPSFDYQQRAREHWAWQPLRITNLPPVKNQAWPRAAIDYFILAKLEQSGLQPAPPADRTTLVRRLYFDLIGLPPTSEELDDFHGRPASLAIEDLVDRLLQSPHFGERWGRHWLDLVRYAESRGHEFDDDSENAYQYRDYVIRALNDDVPYDQFVREHIAGDLIEQPRLNPVDGSNESILGTGFWFLGEWVHSPVDIRKDESDRFDNMIDVMSKTFLGVTVACARCHDHKFDAISTADYYALCGYLQSSDFRQVRFDAIENNRDVARQLSALDNDFQMRIERVLSSTKAAAPAAPAFPDIPNCVNYGSLAEQEFLQDGFIFGHRSKRVGEIQLTVDNEAPQLSFAAHTAATSDTFWDGLTSINEPGAKSRSVLRKIPRSGRTLRTPTFELQQPELVARVYGAGHVVACVDSHRLVAGPLHGETVKEIKPNEKNWVHLKLDRYVGHRLHLEFTPAENSQLAVALILQSPTADELHILEQFSTAEKRIADERQQQLNDLLKSEPSIAEALFQLTKEWSSAREKLRKELRLSSRLAMAMMDGTGEDDRILIRGNSSTPGAIEPRHFLKAIAGEQASIPHGSGRLTLASQINAPDNPLTHRVIVNRLWHHLLGRGIVPTTDDFGVLGQRPSHPELLDYLASQFLQNGRSLKQSIREIVLSSTYQMSSRWDSDALSQDPTNTLWHFRSPKRLEGEVIRDSLLSISGRLESTPFGPPIPIHLTDFMDGRGRPAKSGPLDGDGRRSVYVAVRRNFLSPFLLTFDSPNPFSTMGRRNSSNVPAQALIMMNDPFVSQQCNLWAQRGLTVHNDNSEASMVKLIEWFYTTAFARCPTSMELAAALKYCEHQSQVRSCSINDLAIWSDFAHALVNTKEFVFVR